MRSINFLLTYLLTTVSCSCCAAELASANGNGPAAGARWPRARGNANYSEQSWTEIHATGMTFVA